MDTLRHPVSRCVYHRVPRPMLGTRLRPLSSLAALEPERYERELRKYADHPDRVRLPDRRIPLLDCRWQDVVMLAPIHPHRIWSAWADLGFRLDPDVSFYQFPAEALAGLAVAVFHHRDDVGTADPIRPDQMEWFDAERYQELIEIPPATQAWYRKLAARGRPGAAWFHGMPHVMVRAELDVGAASVVGWGVAASE